MGDFNIDILKNSSELKELKNILIRHGMVYLIDFPTRVTATSKTCIDNILTNINQNQIKVEGIVTALSDHDGQIMELLKIPSITNDTVFKYWGRNFSPDNLNLFKSLLEKEDWLTLYNSTVDKKYDIFHDIFHYYFNLSFPRVQKKTDKKKKNWITKELKEEKSYLINLSKAVKSSNSEQLKKLFKNKSQQYKLNLREAKRNYYNKKIENSENVGKTVWDIINKETRTNKIKSENNFVLKLDNCTISDPYHVANRFNDFFVNVIENMLDKVPPTKSVNHVKESDKQISNFRCPPIDDKDLNKIIDSLKNKWSSGYDDVPIKVIKAAKGPLIKPLMHAINASFISGIFPRQLKIARVIPIYKKGEETNIKNYRPISILPSISKIFEKAMYLNLTRHLEKYNLYNEEQHGFRKQKSTITALISFIESVIDSLDEKNQAAGIFMDLSKAFDSISHSKMIDKLSNLGIKNSYLNWFESYLTNRYQYVEITRSNKNQILKYKSTTENVKYGVPQGSILGPLLFICYIGDMPDSLSKLYQVKNQLCLYADDSNLIMSAKTRMELEIHSFIELAKIKNFFTDNNLILNTQKTNYITFCTKQNKNKNEELHLYMDNKDIVQVETTKFLGIFIDRHLSWNLHIDHILHKINSGIYAIKRLFHFCNLNVLKSVFYAHVQSHVSYGICVYGGTSNQNMTKILIGQKRALRAMLNFKSNESVKQYFTELKILTVYNLYILECIMVVKNNINKFITYKDYHNYNTRNKNKIVTPRHNLELFAKKASYNGIRFLKFIPDHIGDITDNNRFKLLLKEFLMQNPFYSLEEFYNLKKKDNS